MSSNLSITSTATVNNAAVISVGPTNGASASATNTSGSMDVSGVFPPFNLFEGVHTVLGWSGFQWPTLFAGVTVDSIVPVIVYSGALSNDDKDALAFFAPGSFPTLPSSGTWIGPSIGNTQADLEAFSVAFSFQATLQLSNYVGSFVVESIGLRILLTVPGQTSVGINIGNTKPLGS
jgi:hypothetical protein